MPRLVPSFFGFSANFISHVDFMTLLASSKHPYYSTRLGSPKWGYQSFSRAYESMELLMK
jgi:hypothetical protein